MIASKLLTAATSKGASGSASRLLLQRAPRNPSQYINKANVIPAASRYLSAVATSAPSAGSMLEDLAKLNPHKEVVRYDHKNIKMTMDHVDSRSEWLAIGFLEQGLTKGDAVLSWLPSHWAEQHILQFACSKAGLVLYTMDPLLVQGQSEEAVHKSLSDALTKTSATVLVTPETHDDINYIDFCEAVVPEIRIFNFACKLQFLSPRFPHLRFPIHTGFDHEDKAGFLTYQCFLVPSGNLDSYRKGFDLGGDTPLYGKLDVDKQGNVSVGKVMTNKEVIESDVWPEFNKILKRDYFEVEGVGVIF